MTRLRRRATGADERGFVIVYFAITLTVLMAMAGFALDVGNWYAVAQQEQKTADVAALGGVVYMPGNYSLANQTAVNVAGSNGFTTNGVSGPGGMQVTVSPVAGVATQLQVTVTRTVANPFAGIVGYSQQTVTRTAIAEYEAPVAMGSPANIFGNEPVTANDLAQSGNKSWDNVASFTPHLWANVMGPNTAKSNGDAVQAHVCDGSSQDGCPAGTNMDYDPNGYFYGLNADTSKKANSNDKLAIEVFDPATVFVGDHCDQNSLPGGSVSNRWTTAFGTTPNDAADRYAVGDSSNGGANTNMGVGGYCTGDNSNNNNPPIASYVVRQNINPTNPDDPVNAVIPVAGCNGTQFPGWNVNLSSGVLNGASANYDDKLASVFRQWVPVCVFDPAAYPAPNYLVQVRTDVALGGNPAGTGDPTRSEGGSDRFTMRAGWVTATSPAGGYPRSTTLPTYTGNNGIQLYGQRSMGLYANAAAGAPAPNFYMARVLPGSGGQILRVSLWDIGDCSGSGCSPTLSFLIRGSAAPSCSVTAHLGAPNGAAQVHVTNSCSYTVNQSGVVPNGTWFTIDIPIPSSYTCNQSDPTDCWITMNYHPNNGGALNDTTTWSAQILGNPVRLVK